LCCVAAGKNIGNSEEDFELFIREYERMKENEEICTKKLTMCSSSYCSKIKECYRAQEKQKGEYCNWSNFEYTCNEDNGFECFIPMDDKK
jgi:hypothetical protein